MKLTVKHLKNSMPQHSQNRNVIKRKKKNTLDILDIRLYTTIRKDEKWKKDIKLARVVK